MEWVLQAAAVTGLQWAVERAALATHDRWRQTHGIPLTATGEHYFNGWLFALAVATLLYVQALFIAFVMGRERDEWAALDAVYFALFGAMTGWLWTVARRRWRKLPQ